MNKSNLKEDIEKMRKIEGFPKGKEDYMLKLSVPPEFTLFPNPYIEEFISKVGKPYNPEEDNYHKEPYITDISEGKNDPIYNAHTYHTKVPWRAVAKFIEHYTEPGDVVFDGFCGSGMTGVAALMTGRNAILNELSPAAAFIAYNFTHPVDPEKFRKEAERILKEVEKECEWMYETIHDRGIDGKPIKGKINYVVWSDVFICPHCGGEIVFWDVAVDQENGKVRKKFTCPHCGAADLTKSKVERAMVEVHDPALGREIRMAKQVPVLINYSVGKKRYEKKPDEKDLEILRKIEERDIPYWYPSYPIMFKGERWGDTWRAGVHAGITHVHHFYTKRNLWCPAAIYDRIMKVEDRAMRNALLLLFTSQLLNVSVLNRHRFNVSFPYNPLSGTLYVSSMVREANPIIAYRNKVRKMINAYEVSINSKKSTRVYLSTQSTTDLRNIPDNSVDYIFVDPPFGDNLMYSELNFLWESWLRVFTNSGPEAIMNKTQGKELYEYRELMYRSFRGMYRILKPNRWITVEFHNSKAKVWNAIQQALVKAGFVIAMVTTLDKKQKSFKQVTSGGAVDTDLIINAYKPSRIFEEKFLKEPEKGYEKYFVDEHLSHLPLEPNPERTNRVLFSRMVSYYLQHGWEMKMNADEFYAMLEENFVNVDGYWYTPGQVDKIKSKRMEIKESRGQITLWITTKDEAVRWLWTFLREPRKYSEIYTEYVKLLDEKEKIPELTELLEEYFVQDGELWRRPTTEEEKEKEKIRNRKLVREFNKILDGIKNRKIRGKLKDVDREILYAGLYNLMQENRYEDILLVSKYLPISYVDEDPDINMIIENAKWKLEGDA